MAAIHIDPNSLPPPALQSGNPVTNSIGPKCSELLIKKVQNAIYDYLTGNSKFSIISPDNIKINSITTSGRITTIEYTIHTDLSGIFIEQPQTISTTDLENHKDKEKLKKLFKTLGKHVSDIKGIEESTSSQQRPELPSLEGPSKSGLGPAISAASSSGSATTVSKHNLARAEKLAMFFTILAVSADINGVIRNVLGLLYDIGPLVDKVSKAGHALSLAASTITTLIAAFRIFQGVCSLVSGSKNLFFAVREYRKAKENNDTAGMEIAKYKIKSAVVNIFIGLFWITLGIVSLACPHVALILTVISILQWILFYGFFSADSIISILSANKTLSYIDKHRSYFNDYIFNNSQMSIKERDSATANWLKRIFQVQETDLQKIKNKKTAKLARILGIDQDRLNEIIENGDQLQNVKKCFKSTRGEQKASRFLAFLCLAINLSSLQLDGPKAISLAGGPDLSHMATMGCGTDRFWVINDFFWILINALYGCEDGPGVFTKFFRWKESESKIPKGDSAASGQRSRKKPYRPNDITDLQVV